MDVVDGLFLGCGEGVGFGDGVEGGVGDGEDEVVWFYCEFFWVGCFVCDFDLGCCGDFGVGGGFEIGDVSDVGIEDDVVDEGVFVVIRGDECFGDEIYFVLELLYVDLCVLGVVG